MKKIIYIMIAIAMLFNISIVSADVSPYLSLENALKDIEKKNPDILLMDRKIEVLERQHRDALSRAEYAKDKTSPLQNDNIALRKDERLNWKKTQYALNNLKQDRTDKLILLKSDISKKYMDALLMQEEASNIQKEINSVAKSIEQLQVKIKLGVAKPNDVKALQSQKTQFESQLSSLQRQLNIDLLALKKTLGMASTNKLILVSAKPVLKLVDDKNMEARIAKALEKSYTLEKKRQDLELTKLEYDIIASAAIVNLPKEANTLETSIKDKEAAFEEEKLTQEAALWNKYYNLKNLEDTIAISRLDVEIAQINLDTTAALVKIGKGTEIDMAKKRLELAKSNTNLQRAINNYMLSATEFEIELRETK